jgi:hypothetical protein
MHCYFAVANVRAVLAKHCALDSIGRCSASRAGLVNSFSYSCFIVANAHAVLVRFCFKVMFVELAKQAAAPHVLPMP